MHQITILYTENLQNVIWQLYLNKARRKDVRVDEVNKEKTTLKETKRLKKNRAEN